MPAESGGPSIFDVLRRGSQAPIDGDYVIFTNMDICVRPGFYVAIRELLSLGAEALIINRRTVYGWDAQVDTTRLAQFEVGEDHPGMDCFVFPRQWINSFISSEARIGHGHVMRGVLYNLVALADPLVTLTRVGMTYHYNDERPWLEDAAAPSFEANRREAAKVYEELSADATARHRLDAFVMALPSYAR